MSHREQTVQQLDPLTGVNGRPVTVAGSIALVLYASVMTVFNRDDIDNVWLALAAVSVVGVAATFVIVASSPLRPPVSLTVHVVAMSLALLAMVLSAMSMLESNAFVQDDWGTIIVGGMSLILCPYRPPRELLAVAVLAAVFAGFVVLVQVPAFITGIPVIGFVIVALTPLASLSLAGVAFSSVVLKMLRRWQSRANRAVQALADEHREGIARSVQQDRVTILNRDVVPFFTDMLGRDELTPDDRERALEISDTIRKLMVADVDRTWLDGVVAQASGGAVPSKAVRDPSRIASEMVTDQRTAIRALLVAIAAHPGFDPAAFSVRISNAGAAAHGIVRASFAPADPAPRSALGPYLAVLRVVFVDLQVDLAPTSLTVRFSYDRQ
jgi:hypothetical protein